MACVAPLTFLIGVGLLEFLVRTDELETVNRWPASRLFRPALVGPSLQEATDNSNGDYLRASLRTRLLRNVDDLLWNLFFAWALSIKSCSEGVR